MPGLIPCPNSIWLAVAPVDLRLGADGLSLQVQQALRASPCDGSAYLFRNQPKPGDALFSLTPEQWEWLVAGVDWQRLSAVPPGHSKL